MSYDNAQSPEGNVYYNPNRKAKQAAAKSKCLFKVDNSNACLRCTGESVRALHEIKLSSSLTH